MSCYGDETKFKEVLKSENDPYFTIALGPEPFLGIAGFEYQDKNHAIGIGYPHRLAYRYFINPYRDTYFWGMYLGGMSYDNVDETKNGVEYQVLDTKYIGLGSGYRWQWPSGWNINVSIALQYYDYEFSNPGSSQTTTKNGLFAFQGISAGYKF